jgi:hypothetical protein
MHPMTNRQLLADARVLCMKLQRRLDKKMTICNRGISGHQRNLQHKCLSNAVGNRVNRNPEQIL